uniref:Indole-3-glycerol phosphate lyase variant 1 n=1 Tax=Zea nicaraguensis TaxID=1293079 RepID=M4Q348_9POAL|nr:indole-3-glycerol phosphate lyase variant 1 [Zea nicaraguensis]
MAFAPKTSSSSSSSLSSALQAAQSPPLVLRRTSSTATPRRRYDAAAVVTTTARAAAAAAAVTVPAAPPAPAPAPKQAAAPAERRSRPVSDTMAALMAKGKTAFIPYITAGDPDLATTAEALRLLDGCGADVIELGVPCSDPYIDGPIIQASVARALAGGTTMDAVLEMLREVTPALSCPVVLLSYYKPIMSRSLAEMKEAGVHGLIVPDLPYVAAHSLWSEAKNNNLELVLLTTPAIPEDRMKEITKASEGFVYLVSVNGVTGPRANVNPRVESLIQEVKKVTNKPVAVGFGISKPEHVKQIAQWGADGVIIGSAMVRQLGEAASPKQGLRRLEEYARGMKNALP